MPASPRVSVIVPTLNQERFVERTLCSVLDQGYDNLELIVVDGGSTDQTAALLDLYGNEITRLVHCDSAGPADALNRGLAVATGSIITCLGSDDLLLPGALDHVAELMHGEQVTWLVSPCLRIDSQDDQLGVVRPSAPRSLAAFLMHDSGVLPAAGAFIRATVLRRVRGFDAGLRFAFDYDLHCRLLAQGVAPTLAAPLLAAKREHADSITATNMLEAGLETVDVSWRYASYLPLAAQVSLWRNCESRRRIYALAEAELHSHNARRRLIRKLLTHPWWISSTSLRQMLLHGVDHPAYEQPWGQAA